ncbi:MAG: hypothetical protein PHE29_04970 [Tissierellia bacterium]|nr:hypothetical protein [Tissierellia bacterium]
MIFIHNDELINRRNKLMKLALKSDLINDVYIYKLLKNEILDNYIIKLDNQKTSTNSKSIVKKGYLTSDEQFIDLLNNFILYLDKEFYFLGTARNIIIETILRYEKNNKFLFCKHYWGNNDFIPYFKYNIKKFVITGFYNNLKILADESLDIKTLLMQEKIKINKISLRHIKDIDKLYKLLKSITICNANKYCLLYLFSDFNITVDDIKKTYKFTINKSIKINKSQYIMQWEMIIKNYHSKKDAISCILN